MIGGRRLFTAALRTRAAALIAVGLVPWIAVAGSVTAAASGSRLVELVDVDDEINAGMAHRVASAIDAAHQNGASVLVVRINTNGGSVDDALDISQSLSEAGIPTIAFITGRAWSAGSLIAMSCDKIVMEPSSYDRRGAARSCLDRAGGETPVDQKMIAAFRSKMQGGGDRASPSSRHADRRGLRGSERRDSRSEEEGGNPLARFPASEGAWLRRRHRADAGRGACFCRLWRFASRDITADLGRADRRIRGEPCGVGLAADDRILGDPHRDAARRCTSSQGSSASSHSVFSSEHTLSPARRTG